MNTSNASGLLIEQLMLDDDDDAAAAGLGIEVAEDDD
jgi:hypothetical protein